MHDKNMPHSSILSMLHWTLLRWQNFGNILTPIAFRQMVLSVTECLVIRSLEQHLLPPVLAVKIDINEMMISRYTNRAVEKFLKPSAMRFTCLC